MEHTEIVQRIKQLQKEKNAVILAHYYTRPEVQDIADYIGDSLGLSQEAGKTTADIIVFCGVHFMAETASIISPDKTVLIPAQGAGCSLAESVSGYDLKKWKEANPDGIIVTYVNTTAEVKAYSDICCTSANALKVVESIPKDKKILFAPDKNLGAWIAMKTGREMELWSGDCCVHERITAEMIKNKNAEYPDADILIHPESNCSHDPEIVNMPNVYLYSTSGMVNHVTQSPKKQFVIATEIETIHQMKKKNPGKEFIPVHPTTICGQMKKVSLQGVLDSLENIQYEVKVPENIREKAWLPIKRMLEII
ncbi:quinolinate synthase NadA [Odoribacter sp. OttesenSCG-928-G04]|nr:quinolinate synthase NadA [Odoribacter sp. OttesenSCG-928-G04]